MGKRGKHTRSSLLYWIHPRDWRNHILSPSKTLERRKWTWYYFYKELKEPGLHQLQTHNSIPSQLLKSSKPLKASIVIGSFGASKPYNAAAFDVTMAVDPNAVVPPAEPQLRYGKLPEIHHIFRSDPKSPPKIITLVFGAAVLACLPVLLGAWAVVGGNVNHLSKAIGAAPVSHSLFFSSIIAMEAVFFMYYTSWNLFKTLPVAGGVGLVIFLSGTRALSEVQERRLAGLR